MLMKTLVQSIYFLFSEIKNKKDCGSDCNRNEDCCFNLGYYLQYELASRVEFSEFGMLLTVQTTETKVVS